MKSKINQNKDKSWSKNAFKVGVSRSQSIKIYNQSIDKLKGCEGKTNVFMNNLAFIQILKHFFLEYNELPWQVYLAYSLSVEKYLGVCNSEYYKYLL